jgi:hypothetical protein
MGGGGLLLTQWGPYLALWAGMAAMALIVVGLVAWIGGTKAPQVRVVVVEKAVPMSGRADQPPVYPARAPSYPLRGVEQEFQQVGVLVSQDANEDEPTILPLFGRKMATRDRWEYYVASDKFHMWRLPVQVKNRMCDEDVGCDEIFQGDEVVVPDYAKKVFVARIYKYDARS